MIDDTGSIDFKVSSNITSFVCPACGDPAPKARLLIAYEKHSLYRCQPCLSLIYHPFPEIDYRQHTDPLSIRDYVEMNAAIDVVAYNILRVIRRNSIGKLLDIGCGFGFALDSVRTITGWTVRGFEPSQYGAEGRKQLDLDIVSDFAPVNADENDTYNVVHCSEVIEHVEDPAAFLGILTSYLSDDGVLVLTTPNPARIHAGAQQAVMLSLLSPGAHTMLLSESALTALLKQAGLEHVVVDASQASTLYYASRRPIPFQDSDPWSGAILQYYERALERTVPGSSLDIGLRYRLFRASMDFGAYKRAEKNFKPYLSEADPEAKLATVDSMEAFGQHWPYCIAASTYYDAMLHLIHKASYLDAARLFRASHQLCRTKIELNPAISGVEADLIWRATYHMALSQFHAGLRDQAADSLKPFLKGATDPATPVDLVPAIRQLQTFLGVAPKPEPKFMAPSLLGKRLTIAAIIPLYNGAQFIEKSVRSVLEQTRPADEIIVVDDGSTDDGMQIAKDLLASYRGVQIHSKPNGGQSSARNFGVSKCSSDLLAFLDQDDWWYPLHLSVLERTAKKKHNGKFGWVYSDLDEYDLKGNLVCRKFIGTMGGEHPKRTLHNCLGQDMFVLPSASLISREAFEQVGGFDENLSGYEDDDLFLKIYRAGYVNVFVNNSLSGWRIHDSSSSYSPSMGRSAMVYASKLFANFPDARVRYRHYTRDLIAPRFLRPAFINYRNALNSKDPKVRAKALSDLDTVIAKLGWRRRLLFTAIRPVAAIPLVARVLTSEKLRPMVRRIL